jgi:hypothetical protein
MLRAERLVRNQILRRSANEAIAEVALTFDDERKPAKFEFLCECSSPRCTALLPLTTAEYDAVRSDSNAFLVAPGHEVESIERVVAAHADYLVVAKFHPEPTRLAVASDPRDGDAGV